MCHVELVPPKNQLIMYYRYVLDIFSLLPTATYFCEQRQMLLFDNDRADS